MKSGWFERLVEAINSDSRSLSQIAADANLGRNFVQQMIKNGKEPGAEKLSAILATMGDHVSMYILTGLEVTKQDLEFLRLVSQLDPADRHTAMSLLERLAASQSAQERSPVDHAEATSKVETS